MTTTRKILKHCDNKGFCSGAFTNDLLVLMPPNNVTLQYSSGDGFGRSYLTMDAILGLTSFLQIIKYAKNNNLMYLGEK